MAAKFQVLQSQATVFIREKRVERKGIKKHSPLFLSPLLGRRSFLVISKSCCLEPCCISFLTPWTVAHQDPLSMRFPRQEYWSGLSFPSPGDLPDPGIKPLSPALARRVFTSEPPGKPKQLKECVRN